MFCNHASKSRSLQVERWFEERKKERKKESGYPRHFLYKNKKKYDYSERWIIWLMGLWKMQLIARQRVNCRTHEHRHFERTLRSMDTISGSGLAEGRSRNPNTCIAYRYSSYIWSFFSLSFFIIPVVVFKIERFRVGCQKSRRGQVSKEEDARRTNDCWMFVGVCCGHEIAESKYMCSRVVQGSCSRITTKQQNMSRICVSVLSIVSRPFHVMDDCPCFTASNLSSTLFRTRHCFDSSIFGSRNYISRS